MASGFVLAIAAYGKMSIAREGGQQVEGPSRGRLVHLCPEGSDEGIPFLLGPRCLGPRDQRGAGRKVGIPDVEPVFGRKAFLAHAPGRVAHRADPRSFLRQARCAETNDA